MLAQTLPMCESYCEEEPLPASTVKIKKVNRYIMASRKSWKTKLRLGLRLRLP